MHPEGSALSARDCLASRVPAAHGRYLVLPSLSYCEMNAQRSLISLSFLMPAKIILVPGIFAFADRVASHAFIERALAGRDILGQRGGYGGRRCDNNQRAQREFFHGDSS